VRLAYYWFLAYTTTLPLRSEIKRAKEKKKEQNYEPDEHFPFWRLACHTRSSAGAHGLGLERDGVGDPSAAAQSIVASNGQQSSCATPLIKQTPSWMHCQARRSAVLFAGLPIYKKIVNIIEEFIKIFHRHHTVKETWIFQEWCLGAMRSSHNQKERRIQKRCTELTFSPSWWPWRLAVSIFTILNHHC